MSVIDEQIRRTRFRLNANIAMQHAALGVLAAASAWTMLVLLDRTLALGLPLLPGAAAAAALGLIVAGIRIRRARVRPLGAAIVLDRAAGLKERISSALTCRGRGDPFALATIHDAEHAARGVHVPSHLPYRAPQLWPWSLATVIAALIVFRFMPQLDLLAGQSGDDEARAAAQEERKEIQVAFEEQLKGVKERIQEKPLLAGLQEDLKELELPDEPTATPEDVRREAVKKIEKVADRLKQRLEDQGLDALAQLKRDLARLETPEGDDPGSKLTQALASGDMEAARKALGDLKKTLEEAAQSGDLAAQQKLAEMQRQLDGLARQLAQLADQQKLQKDLENKGGLSEEEARKLLEKLAGKDEKQIAEMLKQQLGDSGMTQKQIQDLARKIAQQQQACQQLKSLAQAMGQAAQACQQCQGAGSASKGAAALQSALEAAMGQLSDMEMAEQMMNELQAQLAELDELKGRVCEGNCRGWRPGDPNSVGRPAPNPGQGYGACPRERAPHAYKATRAKGPMQPGQIIGQMFIDGPQVKGAATTEALEVLASELRDAEEAIERDEVQRQYQRVVQMYFEQLAGLLSGRSPAETPQAQATPGAAQEPAAGPQPPDGEQQ